MFLYHLGNNSLKKEDEVLKNLLTEVHHMWNVKVKAISVIISGIRTLSRSFLIYLEDIPDKHSGKELQNMTVPGTAHILRSTVM
jgi:hypothetical protein